MTQSRINSRLTLSPVQLSLRTRNVTSLKKKKKKRGSWDPTFSLHNIMLLLLAEPVYQGLQLIPLSFGSFFWTETISLRLWRLSRPCMFAKAEVYLYKNSPWCWEETQTNWAAASQSLRPTAGWAVSSGSQFSRGVSFVGVGFGVMQLL